MSSEMLNVSGTPAKKIKLDNREVSDKEEDSGDSHFANFVFDRVLNDVPQRKVCFVEGYFSGSEERAVVTLEKTAFSAESIKGILSSTSKTKETLKNDIYGTYYVSPSAEFNDIKASVIYPATEKHISKYYAQECYLIDESPDDYKDITLPCLQRSSFSVQWVYNILEKKTEADRIVFEDPDPDTGFILLPDMKWNRQQIDDLYLVGIVHKHGLKSVRDLTAQHLPLLKNILQQGRKAIMENFGVPANKLRIYLHYKPSYYHLHVHFSHLKFDAPGSAVERAHLLSDVINNIEIDSLFYQKKTLSYVVKETEDLCKCFKQAGRV